MRKEAVFENAANRKHVAAKICQILDRYRNDASAVCAVVTALGNFHPLDLQCIDEINEVISFLVESFRTDDSKTTTAKKVLFLTALSNFIELILKGKNERTAAAETFIDKLVLKHKIVEALENIVNSSRNGAEQKSLVKKAEALVWILCG